MQQNLIIVESPKKAQLITGFLKARNLKGFQVMASAGHIRDLKKSSFSIDVENNFTPEYVVPRDKQGLVKELKKASEKADLVWLASDEDREGEAIAWHLKEVLELPDDKVRRIAFHEITSEAFMEALEHPRAINQNLVDAQQARRVLDRIVGFELSPVLWRRIQKGLSAGRVQSVAARLVVDREREISSFISSSNFRLRAKFLTEKGAEIEAELNRRFESEEEARHFLESLSGAHWQVAEVRREAAKRHPAAPFTTSTLQQEAARKLGYTVSQTMRLAQSLYESGHITYMRTDSVNLSSLALNTTAQVIEEQWGKKYLHRRQYKTSSKGAQEAHEAIRPTYIAREDIEGSASERKLYELIRKRTIASQMASAEIERTTIVIPTWEGDLYFTAVGEVIRFKGFLELYMESRDEDEEEGVTLGQLLPPIEEGEPVQAKSFTADERFAQHPARYTEASMVRTLEKLEIGRPSTYATTIQTIQNRGYVEKDSREGWERRSIVFRLEGDKLSREEKKEMVGAEKNKLFPTDTGFVVNDFLMEQFPSIVDYSFTATVEDEFDEIAQGQLEWHQLMKRFYDGLLPQVTAAKERKESGKVGDRILGLDPESGREVKATIGRFGPMIQIGSREEEEPPRFASLRQGQSMETITLEEALELFRLPRSLGEVDGQEVKVAIGRFGPYVKLGSLFVSIPKERDPLSITLEEALELVREKKAAEEKSILKTFEGGIELRDGRYGPYLKYEGNNYKLPKKGVSIDTLTQEEAMKIIQEQQSASVGKAKRKTSTRKTKK